MTKSQELQVRMSQLRQSLNASLAAEQPDMEQRQKDLDALTQAESDYQAAIAVEANDTMLHERGITTPLSPLLELRSRVTVGEYVNAAMEQRSLAGASAEYNNEMGYGNGANLPWELIAPLEVRQDVVTAPNVINRQPAGRFLDRVMAGTHAAYLGITFDSVAVGTPIHTIMTTGTSASMRAPGQEVDAAAANFNIDTLSPKRMSARYVWRVEDVAKLAGLEDALQRDLSNVMAEHMDYTMIAGDTGATGTDADILGLAADAGVDVTDIDFYGTGDPPSTLEVQKILTAFGGLVDGYYARQMSDIRTLIGSNINQLALSTFTNSAVDNELSIETLRRAGIAWQVHEKLGGVVTNGKYADDAIVGVASRPLHRAGVAVQAVWPTISLIRDMYSGANKGETALTAIALWDFKVLRKESFFRLTTDNS